MIKTTFYCGRIDKDGQDVSSLVYEGVLTRAGFDFTLFAAKGTFEGVSEPSCVFEVITRAGQLTFTMAQILARELANVGNQTAVFVAREVIEAELIFA